MTAFGRHGQPADIADAVAFFASSDGRWVSGQTLEVNGDPFLGPQGERYLPVRVYGRVTYRA